MSVCGHCRDHGLAAWLLIGLGLLSRLPDPGTRQRGGRGPLGQKRGACGILSLTGNTPPVASRPPLDPRQATHQRQRAPPRQGYLWLCGSCRPLLSSEEAFVGQEGPRAGRLLLPLTPSPQTSAALAGTVFFLYQIGLTSHLCRDTPLPNSDSGWLGSFLLWKRCSVNGQGQGVGAGLIRRPPCPLPLQLVSKVAGWDTRKQG